MKIVILCGGKGTRIREVSEDKIPKPMVKIGEYPIVWHIMNHYANYGYKDFVLCLGYQGWKIKEYFLNFKAMNNDIIIQLNKPMDIGYCNNNHLNYDWNVILADTGNKAQTGARIRKIRRYVEKDSLLMLTYGDGLSNININELVKFHKSHNKIATVTGVRPSGRFGEINASKDQTVIEFNEKPQTTGGRINGGFFVLDALKIWDYLPEGEELNFEKESLRELAKDGELMMFSHDGFWQPMDTLREYELLNDIWRKGKQDGNIPWTRK